MPTKKAAAKKAPIKKVAKKAVKKTAKPKTANKTASKKKEEKSLVYASDKKSFWVSDGQILNSLIALRDAFDAMEKEVFKHHVTKDKNDFAEWVNVVLCDEKCAADLHKAKTPKSAKTVVVKHLKFYTV